MDHLVTSERTATDSHLCFPVNIMSQQLSDHTRPPSHYLLRLSASTDRCSAASHEMSYGLFLLHTCGIKENNTSPSDTIEINFRIFCCYVFFLQVHADVSMDLTLIFSNKSYNLKRCGGSFICLYLFFSVGYLQVTTQKPITWKMAQWSQALTTSRYVFFPLFLITFDTMNLF